jgi:NAD(P)-dependent dehydrogenase (short-subunit alcohol dehydrogenase family)
MSKIALITGSNKGIGFEIARQLGAKGFHIIISGRNANALETSLLKLKNEIVNVESLLMDVSDEKSIKTAAGLFASSKRKLDVLINNAAILSKNDSSIIDTSDAVYVDTINTNSHGPLRVAKAFLPFISSTGRIINISSGGGSMTDPVGGWAPAYCVSKSMLNAITRQLAYELNSKGICVNAACPGWVKTDMGGEGATRPVSKGAETPVWLASDAPDHLTGKFFRDKREIPW